MDNVKPWQIILLIIAFGLLGFMVWKFMLASPIPTTNGYMTVDIMTGQLYDIRKGKAKGVPLPAKNPDTGERTLYPVNQLEDQVWKIPSGFESYLTERVREDSKLDAGKLTITVEPDPPIRFVLVK